MGMGTGTDIDMSVGMGIDMGMEHGYGSARLGRPPFFSLLLLRRTKKVYTYIKEMRFSAFICQEGKKKKSNSMHLAYLVH